MFGNHDVTETLVGGFSTASRTKAFRDPRMEAFLEQAGINIMLDEVTTIADGKINLIGIKVGGVIIRRILEDDMSIKKLQISE